MFGLLSSTIEVFFSLVRFTRFLQLKAELLKNKNLAPYITTSRSFN